MGSLHAMSLLILLGARRVEWIVALAWISCVAMHAQDTQFLPELDGHLTLNSSFKIYVQAKDDREGGDPQQFTFGPSVQFFRKPLIRLKNASIFDLDDVKSRLLVVESGYRIITAPDTLRILERAVMLLIVPGIRLITLWVMRLSGIIGRICSGPSIGDRLEGFLSRPG
jgi:hypothetical protein